MTIYSIYGPLLEAGVELDHHYSDLYAKDCEITRKILADYAWKKNSKMFKSNIDGEMWWDIPFAYTPYWNSMGKAAVS